MLCCVDIDGNLIMLFSCSIVLLAPPTHLIVVTRRDFFWSENSVGRRLQYMPDALDMAFADSFHACKYSRRSKVSSASFVAWNGHAGGECHGHIPCHSSGKLMPG